MYSLAPSLLNNMNIYIYIYIYDDSLRIKMLFRLRVGPTLHSSGHWLFTLGFPLVYLPFWHFPL
jgi:hypothetical protein